MLLDIVLHNDSNSPASRKRSCVTALFSRITTHCSNAEARNQERSYPHRLFDSNGYPLNFIKRTYVTRTVHSLLLPTARQSPQHGELYHTSKTYPN